MINSKGIKILCYIIMGCISIVSLVLIVYGINEMSDDESYVIFILLGFILPIVFSVTLYPIFALANIDENVREINRKITELDSIFLSENSNIKILTNESKAENETNTSPVDITIKDAPNQEISQTSILQDSIDFINEKYGVDIVMDDDLNTIKIKVCNISENSLSAKILIKKIMDANNIQDVITAFALHKVANK